MAIGTVREWLSEPDHYPLYCLECNTERCTRCSGLLRAPSHLHDGPTDHNNSLMDDGTEWKRLAAFYTPTSNYAMIWLDTGPALYDDQGIRNSILFDVMYVNFKDEMTESKRDSALSI